MEELFTCPVCKRSGFTRQGLRGHRCDAKAKRRETPTGPLVRQRLTQAELDRATQSTTSTQTDPQP